jgi:hypothetical protein
MSSLEITLPDEEDGTIFRGTSSEFATFVAEQLKQMTALHGDVQSVLSILGTAANPYNDELVFLQSAANRLTSSNSDELQSTSQAIAAEMTKLVRSQKLVFPASKLGIRILGLQSGIEKGLAKEIRALDGQVQVKTNNFRGSNAPWFPALVHASLAINPLQPKNFGLDDSGLRQKQQDLQALATDLQRMIAANKTANDELLALNSVLHEKIITAEPREFWSTYAESQNSASKRSFWTFAAVSFLLPPVILLWITWGVPAIETSMSVLTGAPVASLPTVASYLLIAVPVVLGLWILRFFAKSFAQAIGLRADAQHRVAMVETFLSLMASKRFEPDPREREIVLQALFRPGPGDAQDVSPHESFTNAIAQIMRSRQQA